MSKEERKAIALFRDRMDNVIRVGDYIIYSNSVGRSSRPAVALVQAIYEEPVRWRADAEKEIVITVTSFQDRYGEPYAKDTTLRADVDGRVLKYPEDMIDRGIRKLLAAGELKKEDK